MQGEHNQQTRFGRAQRVADKAAMALDALAKLTRRFAHQPDHQQLVNTFLLTLAGQFATPSTFSMLRQPGSRKREGNFTATGSFASRNLLKTLLLTPAIASYFLENRSPAPVSDMRVSDECRSYAAILSECNVDVICPLPYDNHLLGMIGLGRKVSGRDFTPEELDLLGTSVSTVTPMIVSSYHYSEVASLNAWYLDIMDNVEQGLFVFDDDGLMKKINRTGRAMLERHSVGSGKTAALEGETLGAVFPESVFGDWSRRILKAMSASESQTLQDLAAPDGSDTVLYEAYVSGIMEDSGYATDFIVVLEDVTRRREMEKAVRESEARYRAVSDMTSDYAFSFSIDRDGQKHLEWATDAFQRITGYTVEEILERGGIISALIHPDDHEIATKRLQNLLNNRPDRSEFRIVTRDGDVRHIRHVGRPIWSDAEQRVVGIISAGQDITERKQSLKRHEELKERLERSQRMESLGILAGGVAHDLNNMLGPLVGYPELLLLKLPEDSPLRTQVERMGNAARDAAGIVQDLLTLARRGRYEMTATDVNEVVKGYLDSPSFMKLRESHSNVQVSTHLDPELSKIRGSVPHLTKVVMNLIVNAYDAMPDGGLLTVTTSQGYRESLDGGYDSVEANDYVMLRVSDTGMGIDAADLERIFEPYYSKKKMGRSGSGLGLSVIYGVVKDHKGYYDVLSEVGKGAEFVLYFPVSSAEVESNHDDESLTGSGLILVVDDMEDQRQLAEDLLHSLGYSVHTAASGNEAVEYMSANAADIVVLDMMLGDGPDGLDTYREIIKRHPGQKAVIVSGFSATDRVTELQNLGAGSYVRKPYTRASIARAIQTELAGSG